MVPSWCAVSLLADCWLLAAGCCVSVVVCVAWLFGHKREWYALTNPRPLT